MLEVADALRTVLGFARPLRPAVAPLHPGTLGRVVAEDVRADLDSPPFTKSLMDGFAVRAADTPGELRLLEEIPAGAMPTRRLGPGEATALYTGAPLPDGADAVVMKERAELLPDGRVRVTAATPGQNVLPRGREMTAGEVVIPAGTVVTPATLGLLAALGRTSAQLVPPPRVAILATGDELVGADATPTGGQIRNSNGPMLAAQVARAGGEPHYLGIARDDPAALAARIREGLAAAEVLLLAGGVSAGKYDLVPDVLRGLGVEAHFHKVRMKPGKPLLFGTRGDTLVFGLPGNPVSAFVCFELFVRPALRVLAGQPAVGQAVTTLPLAEPLVATNDRPTYHPATIEAAEVGYRVRPLPWFGSADLRGLLTADALLALPPGTVAWESGQVVEVVEVR